MPAKYNYPQLSSSEDETDRQQQRPEPNAKPPTVSSSFRKTSKSSTFSNPSSQSDVHNSAIAPRSILRQPQPKKNPDSGRSRNRAQAAEKNNASIQRPHKNTPKKSNNVQRTNGTKVSKDKSNSSNRAPSSLWKGILSRISPARPSARPPSQKPKPPRSHSEKENDHSDLRSFQNIQYPKDFIACTRKDIKKREAGTKRMVHRAAKLIVVISMKRLWDELTEKFKEPDTDQLKYSILEQIQDLELAEEHKFMGDVEAILEGKYEHQAISSFQCSGKFEREEVWLTILCTWGIFKELSRERNNSHSKVLSGKKINTYLRLNFEEDIDKWIEKKWLLVLRHTVQNIDHKAEPVMDYGLPPVKISPDTFRKDIYGHLLSLSKAMCVSQAVQPESDHDAKSFNGYEEPQDGSSRGGREPYKREDQRAEYVAEYLCLCVQNAVKRKAAKPCGVKKRKNKENSEATVEELALKYRKQARKLSKVKAKNNGCKLPAAGWKTWLALMYMVVTLVGSMLVGILNVGSRDNMFERIMDSTSTATLLLVTVFGLVKLKSENANALRNLVLGRRETYSFRKVARYVCDGNAMELAFLLHMVEGDRLWLSPVGTCYARGKKSGSVVPYVRMKGKDLARAGSILGNGVLLAPDWRTYYRIEDTNFVDHVNMVEVPSNKHVYATNVTVTKSTEFSGHANSFSITLEELYEMV